MFECSGGQDKALSQLPFEMWSVTEVACLTGQGSADNCPGYPQHLISIIRPLTMHMRQVPGKDVSLMRRWTKVPMI